MTLLTRKYDRRQAAKQPYSGIVYIDGSSILAEDADGQIIASGAAGKDDATLIQMADDSISSEGTLIFAPAVYTVPNAINIDTDGHTLASLNGSHYGLPRFYSPGNNDIFRVEARYTTFKGLMFDRVYNAINIAPTSRPIAHIDVYDCNFYHNRNISILLDASTESIWGTIGIFNNLFYGNKDMHQRC